MKILIVGGAAQGKRARARTYAGPVTANLHLLVREALEAGRDPGALLAALPEAWVVTCDEVGCGVIPADRAERAWREAVGRLCCALAQRADIVERVTCGIPIRLKG